MQLTLKNTNTNKMILSVEGNVDVDIFNATVVGANIKNIKRIGGTDEIVDFHNNHFIVYEMKKDSVVIPNGDLLEIEFNIDYGTYNISLESIQGCNQKGDKITIGGNTATVAVLFQETDILATVYHILKKSNGGKDINKDGVVDVSDLQIMINNRG